MPSPSMPFHTSNRSRTHRVFHAYHRFNYLGCCTLIYSAHNFSPTRTRTPPLAFLAISLDLTTTMHVRRQRSKVGAAEPRLPNHLPAFIRFCPISPEVYSYHWFCFVYLVSFACACDTRRRQSFKFQGCASAHWIHSGTASESECNLADAVNTHIEQIDSNCIQ